MQKDPTLPIQPAQLDWQYDKQGHLVPVSCQFGDVYFSVVDGLAESRYVFLEQNQLDSRFLQLSEGDTFTIAELGFGTGLNFLAVCELWYRQNLENDNLDNSLDDSLTKSLDNQKKVNKNKHLHFISTEKFPLNKQDLKKALATWSKVAPELSIFIQQLLDNYPSMIGGCHRLNFFQYNITLDLWFGEAVESLTKLDTRYGAMVDAWFLDGFAPKCNQELWAEAIFTQIQRLSAPSTTVATFSCAGIVKQGLKNIGFEIKKQKGFGQKREMLTAIMPNTNIADNNAQNLNTNNSFPIRSSFPKITHAKIAIIGAGVSGLMMAWVLANRGIQVILCDKNQPLAGASGNPRGLLAPKLTSLSHVGDHLHTIGYLYSARLFSQFNTINQTMVFEPTTALDLMTQTHMTCEKIAEYPTELAEILTNTQAQNLANTITDLSTNHFLSHAGLVNPKTLADFILTHKLIKFYQYQVDSIENIENKVYLHTKKNIQNQKYPSPIIVDYVVICGASESHQLDNRIFTGRKIRGQLSWIQVNSQQIQQLPKIPLKYGGYCALFSGQQGDEQLNEVQPDKKYLILGASFVRNDESLTPRKEEHQHNRQKLVESLPEMDNILPKIDKNWQLSWHSRVGVRMQTPDYHPLVGVVGQNDLEQDNLDQDRLDLKTPIFGTYNKCKANQKIASKQNNRILTLCGMGSKGYSFAPICAEILADMLMGRFMPVSTKLLDKLNPNRERLRKGLE